MAKPDFKSVDEYIASQPKSAQDALETVRSGIRTALAGAEEVISYKIPTYKLHGNAVLYFAGWKEHFSLYPVSDHVVAALKNDLAAYKVNKATVRFPLSEPMPVKLIERIAKYRAKEVAGREKAKKSKPVSRKGR